MRALRPTAILYLTAGLTYVLDRASKAWAESALAGRPPIRVIPGVLHLAFTDNTGGAFGLGGGQPLLFAGATIVVSGLIVYASLRLTRSATGLALGLVLGGALGNLTDRILRGPGLGGSVVDFVDVRIWPVFNLADSAIVVGAILLALSGLRRERGEG